MGKSQLNTLDRLRKILDEALYRQYARSPTRIHFTYRPKP
jgi:hypothetical protein